MILTPCRTLLIVIMLAGAHVAPIEAEQVRFRFVPIDACGTTSQVPAGPNGALGEQLTGFGMRPQPFQRTFRPNQIVTFRHPYTGRNITVPLTLPEGTPRLQTLADRIVYNYGSYMVEARFMPDGSVEIVYNSGFLRPLAVQ
jgi:hypothetical protein